MGAAGGQALPLGPRGTEEYEVLCDRLAVVRDAAADVLDELGERDAYEQLRHGRSRPAASV